MWSRRQFLKSAGTGFAATLTPRGAAALANAELVLASAGRAPDGSYVALLVSERGAIIRSAPLPARGHGVTFSPATGQFAVFARRPGTFAAVFDARGSSVGLAAAPEGRHFYGHGVFSRDGKLLLATENDFEHARGAIGIYDATDRFRRIGAFDSYGVGPHEMIASADGRLLVVANGGMETHPDYGRTPLNLATMQPNVAFIDADNGTLVARHELPADLHQLSLRHLAVAPKGAVWVGAQYMGSGSRPMPLLARLGVDRALSFAPVPEQVGVHLNNYVGGLASSPDGAVVAATSPTGDAAVIFDSDSGRARLVALENVCGATFDQRAPILSTGSGVWRDAGGQEHRSRTQFDNHLAAMRSV